MANTNQKQLRKAIKKWANGSHKTDPTTQTKENPLGQPMKSPKAKGVPMPGHGKRTNVGDPRKSS